MSVLTGELLAWVAREAGGPGARAVRAQRLTGGIASQVDAVSVRPADGRTRRIVVRRPKPDPPHTPADLVRQEAAILAGIEAIGLPVPRLVAVDADGSAAGVPALAMSMLAGRIVLQPDDWPSYLGQLADVAVRVHSFPAPTGAPDYVIWAPPADELSPPRWAIDGGLWRAAIDFYAGGPPDGDRAFVHHDLQHFNVLWRDGRLSGVTDWTWASRNGPPDGDVAHCRANLAGLHGGRRAEEWRLAWEARAGRRLDPWWDVASIVDSAAWADPGDGVGVQTQIGRRLRITEAEMDANVDALLRLAMRRV